MRCGSITSLLLLVFEYVILTAFKPKAFHNRACDTTTGTGKYRSNKSDCPKGIHQENTDIKEYIIYQ
jgi:hypothetical protein